MNTPGQPQALTSPLLKAEVWQAIALAWKERHRISRQKDEQKQRLAATETIYAPTHPEVCAQRQEQTRLEEDYKRADSELEGLCEGAAKQVEQQLASYLEQWDVCLAEGLLISHPTMQALQEVLEPISEVRFLPGAKEVEPQAQCISQWIRVSEKDERGGYLWFLREMGTGRRNLFAPLAVERLVALKRRSLFKATKFYVVWLGAAVGLCICGSILQSLAKWLSDPVLIVPSLSAAVGFVIAVVLALMSKCPVCKEWWAGEETERDREYEHTIKTTRTRDDGTKEITRTDHYDVTIKHRCAKCLYEWTTKTTQTEDQPKDE